MIFSAFHYLNFARSLSALTKGVVLGPERINNPNWAAMYPFTSCIPLTQHGKTHLNTCWFLMCRNFSSTNKGEKFMRFYFGRCWRKENISACYWKSFPFKISRTNVEKLFIANNNFHRFLKPKSRKCQKFNLSLGLKLDCGGIRGFMGPVVTCLFCSDGKTGFFRFIRRHLKLLFTHIQFVKFKTSNTF